MIDIVCEEREERKSKAKKNKLIKRKGGYGRWC
jgi:hypothetical protein